MSRLALRRSQSSKPHFGPLGLPSKSAGGTSQQQGGQTSSHAAGHNPAARAGGSGGGRPAAAAALSSDSWGSSSDDDGDQSSMQQENRQHQAQQQPHQQAKATCSWQQQQQQQQQEEPTSAGGVADSGRQLSDTCPINSPPQPPSSQLKNYISELYDISDSGSEDDAGEPPPVTAVQPAAAAAVQQAGAAQHPHELPAPAALPGCPICGSRLHGLSLEQRQQHVNACCDATGAAGTVEALPQQQQQEQQPLPGFQRPCFQQQQQAPHSQQQQQPAQQVGGQQQLQQQAKSWQRHPKQPLQQQRQQEWREEQQQLQHQPPPPEPPPAAAEEAAPDGSAPPGQRCKVCGADLGHLRVQQQVAHVKGCMAGRGRGAKQAKQAPAQQAPPQQLQLGPRPAQPVPPPVPLQQHAQQAQQAQQAGGNPLLQMDTGQWLKALGLERYRQLFAEQEIDLTCVHAVSAEELAGIGIADRLHQVRIVQAAEALASQLGLRQLRGTRGGGSLQHQQPAAKKQKQLALLPAGGSSGAAAAAPPAVGKAAAAAAASGAQPAQQQAWQQRHQPAGENPLREAGPRPKERALLASLYPPAQPAAAAVGQAACAAAPTPQLAGGRSLSRGAPAGAASLWAGAAACCEVAPTLGARLAQRAAADPDCDAAKRQPLARGGTAYPAGEESRALRRVRLDALRQELRTHEETVAGLRAMIAQLEREIGEAPRAGG